MGKETRIPSPELLRFRPNAKTTAVKKQTHGRKTYKKNMDPNTPRWNTHRGEKGQNGKRRLNVFSHPKMPVVEEEHLGGA